MMSLTARRMPHCLSPHQNSGYLPEYLIEAL